MVHSVCFLVIFFITHFILFLFIRFFWLCFFGLQAFGELGEFGLNVGVGLLPVFELLDLLLAHRFNFIEELLVQGLLLWVYGLLDLRIFVVGGVTFDACYFLDLLLVPLKSAELDVF